MTQREYYFILVIRTNFRHVNACSELVQSIHILEYMRYKQLLINLYGKVSREKTFDNNMLILKYWCDEGDIFKLVQNYNNNDFHNIKELYLYIYITCL